MDFAYECDSCGHIHASRPRGGACTRCGSIQLTRLAPECQDTRDNLTGTVCSVEGCEEPATEWDSRVHSPFCEQHFVLKEERGLMYHFFRRLMKECSFEEALEWGEKNWPGLVEAFDAMASPKPPEASAANLAGFLRWYDLTHGSGCECGTCATMQGQMYERADRIERIVAEYRAHLAKGADDVDASD